MSNIDPEYVKALNEYLEQDDDVMEPDEDMTIEIGLEGNVDVSEVRSTEQALLYIVVDKSGSMRNNRLEQGVVEGLKEVRKVVNGSKELDYIQTSMTFFGSTLDMRPFQYGENIDISYEANEGATRLYDAIVASCKNMVSQYDKMQNENKTKGVMLIFTDGGENGSRDNSLLDAQTSLKELADRKIPYLVAAFDGMDLSGLGDSLGVELIPIKDEHQLRRLMGFVSKSL